MNSRLVRPLVRPYGVWLLCLGLVLPGVGRAAQGAPTESPPQVREVPGTQEDAPRRLVADERGPGAGEERAGAPRGLRILGEAGGGLVTSFALGVGGGLAGIFLCELFIGPQSGLGRLNCLIPAGLGAFAGVVFGAPLGVWWAGDALGGDGSYLSALSGGAVGLAGGLLLAVVLGSSGLRSEAQTLLIGSIPPALTAVGAVVGYENSQRAPPRGAARAGLQPLLAFTPGAAVLGLSGHF